MIRILITSFCLFFCTVKSLGNGDTVDTYSDSSDAFLTTPELIKEHGYSTETYYVTTDDGYILTLHRIPNGKTSSSSSKKFTVLLQHGLLSSSADWVITGPDKGLGFILADSGYDVWLGNFRGNIYSRNHTSLSVNSDEFWEFSWHESGYYDVPAMIDKILEVTKQEKIFYIGHSMGATAFFVMGSTKPEYNDKVLSMSGLGPIAYLSHTTSTLMNVISNLAAADAEILERMIGKNEFSPTDYLLNNIESGCSLEAHYTDVCHNPLFLISGYDSTELNQTILPLINAHDPAGTSARVFAHFGQIIKSGGFKYYDYGSDINKLKYGSEYPPEYELSKITSPAYLFRSDNDWLATEDDVKLLSDNLGNVQSVILEQVNMDFNNLDYLFGSNVKCEVYDQLMAYMKIYKQDIV